jgi:hypothetical protein
MKVRSVLRAGGMAVALLVGAASLAVASAAGETVLKGHITDPKGVSVEGAMVYVYVSAEVRRNADFISPRSDGEGNYRMVLPPGTYWVVARDKHSDGYGPLMPGDRHSGEPEEVEVGPGETVKDFIVADLRDAILWKRKERENLVKITGTVVDAKGAPVTKVYVIASRTARVARVPDHLSPWVDAGGRFVLYVPPGKYFLGATALFPVTGGIFLDRELTVKTDLSDLQIVVK